MSYIKESYDELINHVTWTKWSEGQRLMVVVVVFSILFSLFVYGVDTVFNQVLQHYFSFWK